MLGIYNSKLLNGKETSIKNFGIFSFKGPDINLDGTTNEYIHDKNPREPIFLFVKILIMSLKKVNIQNKMVLFTIIKKIIKIY